MQDLVVFYPADLAVFCGVTGPGRRRRRRAGDRAAADVRVRFRVVLSPAARAPTPIRAKSRAGGEAENFASLFLRGPTGKELWFSLAFPFLPQLRHEVVVVFAILTPSARSLGDLLLMDILFVWPILGMFQSPGIFCFSFL